MWASIAITIICFWLMLIAGKAANGHGIGNAAVAFIIFAACTTVSAFISFCWIFINIGRSIGP